MASDTSLFDIAQLLVYDYGPSNGSNPSLPTDDGTWVPVTNFVDPTPSSIATAIGFKAQAFRNSITGEIVVTFRGTNNVSNYAEDALLGTASVNAPILNADTEAAIAFAEAVAKANPLATITFAGHSLGGYDAQAATVAVLRAGLLQPSQLTTVTFNAPGLPPWLLAPGTAGSYENAYNFNTQGDIVHLAGGVPGLSQIGQSVTVAEGPTAAQEWQLAAQVFTAAATGGSQAGVAAAAAAALVKDWILAAHTLNNFVGINTSFNNQQGLYLRESYVGSYDRGTVF